MVGSNGVRPVGCLGGPKGCGHSAPFGAGFLGGGGGTTCASLAAVAYAFSSPTDRQSHACSLTHSLTHSLTPQFNIYTSTAGRLHTRFKPLFQASHHQKLTPYRIVYTASDTWTTH